jgi:hypothetical protein
VDPDSVSPDYFFDPGPVTTGIVLLATVLFSAAVDKLEGERLARLRSREQRDRNHPAGQERRPVGRPLKVS